MSAILGWKIYVLVKFLLIEKNTFSIIRNKQKGRIGYHKNDLLSLDLHKFSSMTKNVVHIEESDYTDEVL